MRQVWNCCKDPKAAGGTVGAGWESEAVGTKQQWGEKLTKAIAKRQEKLWKEEVKKKPKLSTYDLVKN